MADEINVKVSLAVEKGFPTIARGGTAFTPDMTGNAVVHQTQNINTVEEALDMGDVTAPGWFYIRNLDPTNKVSLRQATGAADFCDVLPGEEQVFRFAVGMTAPFAIASGSAVWIEYMLCSN